MLGECAAAVAGQAILQHMRDIRHVSLDDDLMRQAITREAFADGHEVGLDTSSCSQWLPAGRLCLKRVGNHTQKLCAQAALRLYEAPPEHYLYPKGSR